jgi:hypothetical protein
MELAPAPPTPARPLAPLAALAALWGASWLLLALLDPIIVRPFQALAIGLLVGMMFAQATLAAGWTAFGPLPLAWRLPLALVWLASVTLAFTLNMLLHHGGDVFGVLAWVGMLLGQWLLAQIPLWVLRHWKRLHVCHQAEMATGRPASDQQFGIRQLMILTAVIATLLGGGRAIILSLELEWLDRTSMSDEVPLLIFMPLCNVLLALPLLMGPLLPRRPVWGCVVGLGFVCLVTAFEVPVALALSPHPPSRWEDVIVFCSMNYFHAAWATATLFLLRLAGYRLVSPGAGGFASAPVAPLASGR